MSTTDAESYLNELVGRTVLVQQQGCAGVQFLNVLSLNNLGLLTQDLDHEYFIPWASICHLRLATDDEKSKLGSLHPRIREGQDVLAGPGS